MKQATLEVSPEVLAAALHLPPGVTVERMVFRPEKNVYEVAVEGDNLPEATHGDPAVPAYIVGRCYCEDDHVIGFNWIAQREPGLI